MSVSPSLRRAVHAALDIVLDAIGEDAREDVKPATKRRRGQVTPRPIAMPDLPPAKRKELEAQLEAQLAQAGYKKR